MPDEILHIREEDPRSKEATLLIEELSRELGRRYGDDGKGDFEAEDALGTGACFLIVWGNDRPIGCGALRPLKEDIAEVKRMYIHPDARGKGMGRRLLEELEHRARRFGYRRIWLETGLLQPEAMKIYDNAGYRRIPPYGFYKEDPRCVCYEKELQG